MGKQTEPVQKEIGERRTILDSPPLTINIELTGRCNVKLPCVFCYGKNQRNYEEPGCLDGGQLDRWLGYMARCQRVNDCSYGEPLLFHGLERFIDHLIKNGVEFGFTTNGLLLDRDRSQFLAERSDYLDFVVSVNAATKESYFRLHGQDFRILLSNIESFVDIHARLKPHKDPSLHLSYIVMRSNYDEVFDFLKLAQRCGVKSVMLRHLFRPSYDNYICMNFGSQFSYQHEKLPLSYYKRLEHNISKAAEFHRLNIMYLWDEKDSMIAQQSERGIDLPCLFPWKFLCIRPLHDIYTPCPFLKKSIASPSATTVEEVWNGAIMQDMRRSLLNHKIPRFCLSFGEICPLVMNQRETAPEG